MTTFPIESANECKPAGHPAGHRDGGVFTKVPSMRRVFSAAAAALTLALTAAGPAIAQEALKAATDCAYFPFSFRDTDGVLKGYEIDMGEDMAKRANFKIEWVCQKFDGLIPSLLSNKFDMIVSTMSITEKRRESIDFSVSYRMSVGQFVGPKAKAIKLFNADGTPNAAAFKGLRVGLGRATTYDTWMQAKVPDATVVRYDTDAQMYLELKAGRVDVLFTNPLKIFLEFLSKPDGAGYEVNGPQIRDEKQFGIGVGVGVRKGNDALLKRIDSALNDMKKDGSLDRYSKKYFPFAIY